MKWPQGVSATPCQCRARKGLPEPVEIGRMCDATPASSTMKKTCRARSTSMWAGPVSRGVGGMVRSMASHSARVRTPVGLRHSTFWKATSAWRQVASHGPDAAPAQ